MSGRTALVTGASEGIGRAFVKRFASEGYVVTCVARNEARLKALVGELGSSTGHRYVVADLSTDAGIATVKAEMDARHFDLFLNNAGFGIYQQVTSTPESSLRDMINLNVLGMTLLARHYLLTARSGDALVNMSSVLAELPMPGASVYSATKAFVTSFSESLWFEQRQRGVYVMGLCPGATESEFHNRAGGREGDVPKAMFQTAEQLVETGMRGLRCRSCPTVVSGFHNKIAWIMTRLLPRRAMVTMMGKNNRAGRD